MSTGACLQGKVRAIVYSHCRRTGATGSPGHRHPGLHPGEVGREALKDEERLLGIMRAEVTAKEARVKVLRSALESVDKKDWEPVIGIETRLPRSPSRPSVKRA